MSDCSRPPTFNPKARFPLFTILRVSFLPAPEIFSYISSYMSQKTAVDGGTQLRDALQRAEIVRNALKETGRDEWAERLAEVISSARSMRFAIGVIGQAKRGKSTLINGLLGRSDDSLAPVNRFPATNVVSCFTSGPKEEVKVLFHSDGVEKPAKSIPSSDIKHYACEEFNPGNQKGVKVIEVMTPFPLLGANIVLVDTPGADNALSSVHDMVLLDFLPRMDAVIFLVTADEPLTASELELLKHVRHNDMNKLLFAINKTDKVEPDELAQGIEHNKRALADVGYGNAPIFPISAKIFQKTGADDGTERLIFAISELIGEGRAKTLAERLVDITNRSAAEAKEDMSNELRLCEKSKEQIQEEKLELATLREGIARTRPGMESKFRSAWRNAFSEFEDALPAIEKQMISEYSELVKGAFAPSLNALGKTIHMDVLRRLDELLEPHAGKLTAELDGAARSLQVDYCGALGLASRQIEAITNNKDVVKGAIDIALSGVPCAIGAFVMGSLPSLVGTAIVASAHTVASFSFWHISTWLPAIGSGSIVTASGVATTILSPLAAFGVPILIGYAGITMFHTWKAKVNQTKNELFLAVKELVISVIAETRRNIGHLRSKDDDILTMFSAMTSDKLAEYSRHMDELLAKRPTPEHIIDLQRGLQVIDKLKAVKETPAAEFSVDNSPKRLFSV